MAFSVNQRVRTRRNSLRAAGLQPVRIWVPDTSRPGFTEECQAQSRIVALSDAADLDLTAFLDQTLLGLDADELT